MASQLLPPMSFWPTTKHKAPHSCKFTLGCCTAPLPIESQLLSLQGGSWSQRAATNRTVTLSPRVAVPRHPSRRQRGRAGWARMGAFPIVLLLSCPSFRRVARWAGRPGRWAPVIASACALLVRNESLISQIPRLLWPRGRGLGAPGCVSNFSSPRPSLLPLGRALGRTAGLVRSRRPASGWIATSHNESQGARSLRQMCSRGGAGWARLGAFPIVLLLACPCFRWVARWAGRDPYSILPDQRRKHN